MNNLQVVIDAGHGGTDPGAVSSSGVREKDLTLQIAQYMYQKFQEAGIPVTLIRPSDETLSPTERVQRILNAYGNNPNVVVISNHINAAGSGIQGAEGAEVIYALRNNDTLAKNVLQALENSGQVVRKYFQRRLPSDTSKDYYFIHRNTGRTEPIIVEYGFIDNPTDLAKIQNNYKNYVDAVVNAVITTKRGGTVTPSVPGSTSGNTYTVKSGDSLWSIANKYNTTVNELKSLNNLTSNNLSVGQVLKVPGSSGSTGGTVIPTDNTYTVKSGDSLWSIANKFNTTVNELMKLNNLSNSNLSVGQVLKIKEGSSSGSGSSNNTGANTYTVKSGDSLWSIANKFNTTVNNLKSLNNLTSDNLSIGQVLKISGSSTNAPAETTENVYTVKAGDSLWSIANKYGTDINTIKSLNNLSSNTLMIGQTLKVPSSEASGNTYTVKSGDSLWSIANKYGTNVNTLKNLNGLSSNTLTIGQTLKLP